MSSFPPVRPAPRSVPLERTFRSRASRAGIGIGAGWSWRRPGVAAPSPLRLVLGIVGVGVGVGLVLASGLGANPWDVLAVALTSSTGLPLTVVFWAMGSTNLVAAMLLGQRPGFTTIVPTLICGPIVEATLRLVPASTSSLGDVVTFAAGFAVIAVGAGVYLASGCRPGPTDLLFHGLAARGLRPWQARLSVEGAVLATGVALGGPFGAGTAVLTVGLAFAIPEVTDVLTGQRRGGRVARSSAAAGGQEVVPTPATAG